MTGERHDEWLHAAGEQADDYSDGLSDGICWGFLAGLVVEAVAITLLLWLW